MCDNLHIVKYIKNKVMLKLKKTTMESRPMIKKYKHNQSLEQCRAVR